MDDGVMVFAQVMTVIMSSLAVIVVIGLGTRILWRLGSRARTPAVRPIDHREEIERLQTAVDTIAIEVERISEAQRFTVTLLTNRLPSPADDHPGELPPGALAPVDTPH